MASRVIKVAGYLAVACLIGACSGAGGSSPGPTVAGTGSSPGATVATATESPSPPSSDALAGFPTEILGLPVHSVSEAIALRDAGKLDGRAVAVAGYFVERAVALPCPAPMVRSPLTEPCTIGSSYLMETPEQVETIVRTGNSIDEGFREPESAHLAPFFQTLSESVDLWQGQPRDKPLEPKPVILIGHVGDPLEWFCPSSARNECMSDFVVDKMAWVDGSPVDHKPIVYPQQTHLSVGDARDLVINALPTGSTVVALGGLEPATEGVASIDPRVPAPAANAWVARALVGAIDGSGTRALQQVVLDDTTGKVVDERPVATPAKDAPAAVFLQTDWPEGSPLGSPAMEWELRDAADATTHRGGSGWPTDSLILDPGHHDLTVGWAQRPGAELPPLTHTCTMPLDLVNGQVLWLKVSLYENQACTIAVGQEPG